jgi:hypothetical protein
LLQLPTRFFTHADETDEQLVVLAEAALGLMSVALAPLGWALTRPFLRPRGPPRS